MEKHERRDKTKPHPTSLVVKYDLYASGSDWSSTIPKEQYKRYQLYKLDKTNKNN